MLGDYLITWVVMSEAHKVTGSAVFAHHQILPLACFQVPELVVQVVCRSPRAFAVWTGVCSSACPEYKQSPIFTSAELDYCYTNRATATSTLHGRYSPFDLDEAK